MVEDFLTKRGQSSRQEIDRLLRDKLSDALTTDQKSNFITNFLQEMRRERIIQPVQGKRGRGAKWELCKP